MSSNTNPELWTKLEQAQNYLMHAGKLIHEVQYALKPTVTEQPKPQQEASRQDANAVTPHTVDGVRMHFPEELEARLSFEMKGDYIIVKPKQFLGSENFAKIAQIIKNSLHGQYISAGKDSRFEIPAGGS